MKQLITDNYAAMEPVELQPDRPAQRARPGL